MISNKYAKIGMMFGLIICIAISMMAYASAEDYLPHKQNTPLDLVITSNVATSCTLLTITQPDGSQAVQNINLTKNGQAFSLNISTGNYTQLGNVCHKISCTDGTDVITGSECRLVTPDGILVSGSKMSLKIFASISSLVLMVFFLFLSGYGLKKDEEGSAIRFFFIGLGIVFLISHILITTNVMYSTFGEDSMTTSYGYVMKSFFIILIGMFLYVMVKLTVKEVTRLQKLKGLA